MSRQEIKEEIQKIIDTVPDEVLNFILDYLQAAKDKSSKELKFSRDLGKILEEDSNLLKRLAK